MPDPRYMRKFPPTDEEWEAIFASVKSRFGEEKAKGLTGRSATWYWKIWWWIGYHGLYQINWWYKKQVEKFAAYNGYYPVNKEAEFLQELVKESARRGGATIESDVRFGKVKIRFISY